MATILDDLPGINTFFGYSLHAGAIIISTVSILHPLAFCCTFCVPFSFIFLTIWILVVVYFATTVMLVFGLIHKVPELCMLWIWYTFIMAALMCLLLLILLFVYTSRRQKGRVVMVIAGICYYGLSIYFAFVINSYRKANIGVTRKS